LANLLILRISGSDIYYYTIFPISFNYRYFISPLNYVIIIRFMHKIKTQKLLVSIFCLVLAVMSVLASTASDIFAATTTPATINYQGRLLDSSNNPLAGNYTFRFSIWNTADWVAGDTTGGGAINVGSVGYAGWQETHAVTTDTFGLFNMALGDTTPIPNFTAGTHKNLQVEVKPAASPDTSYEILDPAGTLADVNDRKPINNQPYAVNADYLDNAEIGTNAGNIAVLGVGNVFPTSTIPGGTNANNFILDNDNTGGDVTLQFGALLNESLTWDSLNSRFNLSDDLNISGGLTANGNINFSAASEFHIREVADEAFATCTTIKELVLDTTENKIYVCTAIGSPGSWVSSVPAAGDMEAVYAADADKTLTTGNNNFTVNSGTGDFIVTSNDWSVDAAGNATFAGTVNGVNLSSIPFSNLATRVKKASFAPNFDGATSDTVGGANKGTLKLETDGATKQNYYQWTTVQAAMQDIDVVLSASLPLDFVSFTATPINLFYKTSNGVIGTNKVDVTAFDTTGAAIALVGGTSLANAAWTNAPITFGGAPTFTAGQPITIRIKLSTTSAGFARVSDLVLNYNGR
jgi:hypothetical protein